MTATNALTATHPNKIMAFESDLEEAAIEILILQVGIFCRKV